MKKYKLEFMKYFDNNYKDECVNFALKGIRNNFFTIPQLYEEILTPALYSIDDCPEDYEDCIWQEHIKTSIVKTVIECVYPEIINQKKEINQLGIKVVLACPEQEYHEVGLRMISDFFTLNGYRSIYIGSNTPRDQVSLAIVKENPKYAAISVTDYYLLFETQKLIKEIRGKSKDNIKIILGGSAFQKNMNSFSLIGGDVYLKSYEDIVKLKEDDLNEISI
ncbi:MAG: cobalamin B12-binding domain-containing protein [Bacillota bacterium]|nr:cobalamin B12-binding domain-containing protein [Bacillota bacterium]